MVDLKKSPLCALGAEKPTGPGQPTKFMISSTQRILTITLATENVYE